MRVRQVVPIALVLALVASSLFWAAVPARAGAVPAAKTLTHPLATDSITPTDQFGYGQSDYWTGYSQGVVYFTAYDPSDTSAQVAINDLNATRDGLTNPVFTATPSFSGGPYNSSYLFGGAGYLIPLTLNFGGTWNITITGATAGFSYTNFTVHTYRTTIETTTRAYLPGHTAKAMYEVYRSPNTGPYSFATVTVLGKYWTKTAAYSSLFSPKSFPASAFGNFSFNIPLDASTSGQIVLSLWANVTSTTVNASETAQIFTPTGNLSAPGLTLSDCAVGCGSVSSFPAGAAAYLSIEASVVGFFPAVPAEGIHVQLQFINNGAAVVPPNVPLNLTTNATGGAQVLFLADPALFSTTQANEVVVTLSDPSNIALGSFTGHVFFGVQTAASTPAVLALSLDSQQYFGGDKVTATWQLGTAISSAATGWIVGQWIAFTSTNAILNWSIVNSTQSQGTFSFVLPGNFGGGIYVEVQAYNASSFLTAEASAAVTPPTILLNPSELYYLPGDTVTVSVTTEGSVFTGTTLYQSVVTSGGLSLASGALSGTTITVSIPKTAPPGSITVSVAAQSATLGVVGSASVTISEAAGYILYAGVGTKSNYPDGSYQPGQTIQISYQLTTEGAAVLPKSFQIYIYPGSAAFYGGTPGTIYQESTSPSGSVSYTIPSGTPAGIQTFTVYVESAVCGYYCGTATNFAINVQPSPSPLGYEVGAGSGLTVGWIVLFILLIVIAIVLYLAIRRGGRGGSSRPEAMKPYSSSSSGGGSSETGATWKENQGGGASGDSTPPPMPQSPPH